MARHQARAVGVLSLAVFMSSLDLFIVNLAFPAISHAFGHTTLGALSWVLNGYTLVFAAVLVPAGRWADRVGRRRMLASGLTVFALGSACCGLAPDTGLLVASRALQALGAGLMVPASLSLLLAVVPAPGRARALGTWAALGALGAAVGPVLGGALVEADWRWVFWVNLPVAAVAVPAVLAVLPESRDLADGERPDLLGAAQLAGGIGLVAYGLVEAPSWGWSSARLLASLAGGILLVLAVLWRSARRASPVIDPALLSSRPFAGTLAASILYYAGFGAFVLSSVELLTAVWHYSPVAAGLAICPGPLTVLPFARLVAPRLAGALGGAGRVAALGCAVHAASQLAWFALIGLHPAYAAHLLPVQLAGGAGVGLAIPSLLGAGTAGLPEGRLGAASGVLNMGRQLGTVLGVAALVAILAGLRAGEAVTAFRHGLLVIVGFDLAAAVVCAVVLGRPSRAHRRAPAGPFETAGTVAVVSCAAGTRR